MGSRFLRGDRPGGFGGGDSPLFGSYIGDMDALTARVDRLESDVREVKQTLTRLEPLLVDLNSFVRATLPHLATKADVTDKARELADAINKRPTYQGIWTFVAALAGLLALFNWESLAKLWTAISS